MSFVTDKQTLADLNLMGKYRAGSMFNLFSRVKTRGGGLLLEKYFHSPLTSAVDINRRAARIRYVQELDLSMDIDPEMTEMASQYLAASRPSNKLSSLFITYREKIGEMLYRSDKYYVHQRHIHAVQEVLLSASTLLGQLRKKEKNDNPCKDLQHRLEKILHAPSLKELKAKYPYTTGQTAHCHFLFLHRLRAELEELLHVLYELDVYISVAWVAAENKFVYPVASEPGGARLLHAVDLRHPSLPGAVGNTLTLTKDRNLLFLTGANMAGKSTWMKALGVSFYLGHMGFPVAADCMEFQVMEGIYTSINVPDDISQGWSHFYAEVMRVKRVAEEVSSGKRLFVLFDELFKGTNVKDAYDATLAVTQKLSLYRRCMFVISTHIIEVGEALDNDPSIQFYYMPTVMDGAVPRYTYQLTEGITSDRQGMIIIENEKILEMLEQQNTSVLHP